MTSSVIRSSPGQEFYVVSFLAMKRLTKAITDDVRIKMKEIALITGVEPSRTCK
jgi:hypothetical protein